MLRVPAVCARRAQEALEREAAKKRAIEAERRRKEEDELAVRLAAQREEEERQEAAELAKAANKQSMLGKMKTRARQSVAPKLAGGSRPAAPAGKSLKPRGSMMPMGGLKSGLNSLQYLSSHLRTLGRAGGV